MKKSIIESNGTQSFSVPYDEEGKKFLALLRKYQNYPDCQIKFRGRGKRVAVGASDASIPLCKSEWVAVYIRSSKEDKRVRNAWEEIWEEKERVRTLHHGDYDAIKDALAREKVRSESLADSVRNQAETIARLRAELGVTSQSPLDNIKLHPHDFPNGSYAVGSKPKDIGIEQRDIAIEQRNRIIQLLEMLVRNSK